MCAFQFLEDPPPSPSSLLPTGSNPEVSPETIDSSLVTVINRDEIPISNIDSLDDVSSLSHDTPDFLSTLSSSTVLPDPSPFLTYVRQSSPVLPLPERPQISPEKKEVANQKSSPIIQPGICFFFYIYSYNCQFFLTMSIFLNLYTFFLSIPS